MIWFRNLLFFISIVSLASCSTSSVVVKVQRPADITIPSNINNLVLANRSTPSKENLAGNIFEGIVTGEGIGADRKGSEYCLMGLSTILNNSERYTLKNSTGLELKGTGTSSFPAPLKWKKVKSLCSSYDADALLVLETFDSDSRVIVGAPREITRKIKGVKVKEIRVPVTLVMEIQSGWRIYDASNKKIIDENKFTEVKEFKAWGVNPKIAESKLPSRRQALKDAGVFAGEQFALRISPVWTRVRRLYYSGKNEHLKRAKSHVKREDWESAINIWKDLTNNSDEKIAGRSCYNMALASEIKGGLDTAIEWAEKARKKGEKRSRSYISTLHKRKADEEKLKQQLNK